MAWGNTFQAIQCLRGCRTHLCSWSGVGSPGHSHSKPKWGKTPKMDGENNGKRTTRMDDLGIPLFFGNTHINFWVIYVWDMSWLWYYVDFCGFLPSFLLLIHVNIMMIMIYNIDRTFLWSNYCIKHSTSSISVWNPKCRVLFTQNTKWCFECTQLTSINHSHKS